MGVIYFQVLAIAPQDQVTSSWLPAIGGVVAEPQLPMVKSRAGHLAGVKRNGGGGGEENLGFEGPDF